MFVAMSEPAQNVKAMLFLSKTILKNCLVLLKYSILAVLALVLVL